MRRYDVLGRSRAAKTIGLTAAVFGIGAFTNDQGTMAQEEVLGDKVRAQMRQLAVTGGPLQIR